MFDQDKTEAATPRRRQQAREEGRVARSQDLAGALVLLAGLVFMLVEGKGLCQNLALLVQDSLTQSAWVVADQSTVLTYLSRLAIHTLGLLLGLLVVLVVAGLGGGLVQAGWQVRLERISPDFSRLNPATGLTRLFSMEGVMRGAAALVKLGVCVAMAVAVLWHTRGTWLRAEELDLPQLIALFGDVIFKVGLALILGLFACGLLDYLWQRFKWEQDLRMTVQEVREEIKETIGDPLILRRRRQMQYERSSSLDGPPSPPAP